MFPDDGPKGPKHVGVKKRKDILNVNCGILCFSKGCICWWNNFVLIKIHGETAIKHLSMYTHSLQVVSFLTFIQQNPPCIDVFTIRDTVSAHLILPDLCTVVIVKEENKSR